MTSMTPMTRTATFRARDGRVAQLAERLLHAASPMTAVRVAPASARELEAGPNGLEVLAFGSHSPGDGELVADWWTT
jgi:hypothetical protein